MSIYKVKQGRKYKATIRLGLLESFASNGTIADKLRFVGFAEVEVLGSGSERIAEGRWLKDDASAPLPEQVVEVIEIDEDD